MEILKNRSLKRIIICAFLFFNFNHGASGSSIDSLESIINEYLLHQDSINSGLIPGEVSYIINVNLEESAPVIYNGCDFVTSEPEDHLDVLGVTSSVCDTFNAFNANNPSRVQSYIIYIHFPDKVLGTDMVENQIGANQPLSYYWENRGEDDKNVHDSIVNILKSKLPDIDLNSPYDPDKNRILTVIGGFYLKVNGEAKAVVSRRYGYKNAPNSAFLNDTIIRDYYSKTYLKNGNYNTVNFINKTIDYFTNFVDPNASCDELKSNLVTDTARAYIDKWCTLIEANISLKSYVFKIGEYIDKYPFLQALTVNQIDDNYISMTPQDWLDFFTDHPDKTYLDGMMDKLNQNCDDYTNNKSAQGLKAIIDNAEEIFWNNLNKDQIICLLKYFFKQYNDDTGVFEWAINWAFTNNDFVVLEKLFKRAQALSSNDCAEIRDSVNVIPKSAKRIMSATDALFTLQGTEAKLTAYISNVSMKAFNISAVSLNGFSEIYVWRPGSIFGYTNCIAHHNKYHYKLLNNNSVIIRGYLHPRAHQNSIVNTFNLPDYSPSTTCVVGNQDTNYQTQIIVDTFNVFDAVGIVGGGYVNMFSDCNDLQCEKKLEGISAFHFAWLAEKNSDDAALDQTFALLQVVGAFVGYTEIMAAWKAKNYIKVGWWTLTTLADIGGSVPAQALVTAYCVENNGTDSPEDAIRKANEINEIMGVVSLGGAGINLAYAGVKTACKVYTNWKSVAKSGGPQGDDLVTLGQRCEAINDILKGDPLLIYKALDEVGLSTIKPVVQNLDESVRVYVIGHIFGNVQAIKTAVNPTKMVEFIETMAMSNKQALAQALLSESKLSTLLIKLKTTPAAKILDEAAASEEFAYMLMKAEVIGTDIIPVLGSSAWDEALLATLRTRLDDYAGLADEMAELANGQNLFRHFQGLFKQPGVGFIDEWFYMYGLKRGHLVGTSSPIDLPPRFLNVLDDIEVPAFAGGGTVGDLGSSSAVGTAFDDHYTQILADGFTGGSWQDNLLPSYSNLPSNNHLNVLDYLNANITNDYNVMVVNGWANTSGGNSACDVWFFQTLPNGKPNLASGVRMGEIKIDVSTSLNPGGQTSLKNDLSGTFIAEGSGNQNIQVITRNGITYTPPPSPWDANFLNEAVEIQHFNKAFTQAVDVGGGQTEIRMFYKILNEQ